MEYISVLIINTLSLNMIPQLNQLFFFVSVVFGFDNIFIAEQSNVSIDMEISQIVIEYVNIRTTENIEADEISSTISSIAAIEPKDIKMIPGLTLIQSELIENEETLDMIATFSFESFETLSYILLQELREGESISYKPMKYENVLKTNGKKKNDIITWKSEQTPLKIEINHRSEIGESWLGDYTIELGMYDLSVNSED